jgi:hypothetical protein
VNPELWTRCGWLYEYPASGRAAAKAKHDIKINTFIFAFGDVTAVDAD